MILFALALLSPIAHAAPQCPRPATAPRQSIVAVNSFAQNGPARAIASPSAACAWGIGLAMPGGGTGTAFVIANPREVMTDLHVVDRNCRGNRRFAFSHGFSGGGALSTETATVVVHGDYCAALARGRHDYGGDWAIAVLDRNPAAVEGTAGFADMSLIEPRPRGDWLMDNGRYFLLGYGMSFRAGMQPYRSAPCRLGRLFSTDVVEHSCDATHRGSGAPIVIEDSRGRCLLAAIHIGEIAEEPGRPPFIDDVNANVAVLASRFAASVKAVARELEQGRDAEEIATDLARRPAR